VKSSNYFDDIQLNTIRSGDLTLTRFTHWKTWVTTTQSASAVNEVNIVIDQGTDEYYGRIGYASAMAISGGDDPVKPKAQGGGGAELRGSLNDWGNYLGFGAGAAEYNLGKVIAGRAKYSFTQAPYETRIPIKGNTTIRTPVGNLSVNASKLANGLKWGGRALGGAGIVLTGIQAYNGDISYGEAALDASFGVVGFFGPVGFVVSSTYFFAAKPLYNYYTKP